MTVPFFEFRDFPEGISGLIEEAVQKSVRSKQYILGSQVSEFEKNFSAYLGVQNAVGAGNGYDALVMALFALKIGKGAEVIVPANSFVATANAVVATGARPVFAEPDAQTSNVTAATLSGKISNKTKAIIPVHLYGQACEMDPIIELAKSRNLFVIEDFAQSQGAAYKGQKTGSFGVINATSFYPAKNLGALGDGGCVTSNHPELATFVRRFGNYGQSEKYFYETIGINSRLDTLQAAVLNVKLGVLDQTNTARRNLAAIYTEELSGIADLILPFTAPLCDHIFHVYSIRTKKRDELQKFLLQNGISTLSHYPVPIHLQKPYVQLAGKKEHLPVTEHLAYTSLSLPIFPGMKEAEQHFVIEKIKQFFKVQA